MKMADRPHRASSLRGLTAYNTFNGHGNLLTFTDAKNQTTAFTYDPRDRLAAKTDALLGSESYQYDGAGNLLFHTDRQGQVTGYTYDPLDRRTGVRYGATSTSSPVYLSITRYSYDAGGRLPAVVDSESGTLTRSYDHRFHSVSDEVSPEGTVSYTYAADGQRASLTPTGGTPLTYGYDAAGNRIATGGSLARTGLPQASNDAQYDANNRLINRDGVSYTYDANGNLLNDGTSTYTWKARPMDGACLARRGCNERDQLIAVSGPDTLTYAEKRLAPIGEKGRFAAPLSFRLPR